MTIKHAQDPQSNPAQYLTIVLISDTHELHRGLDVPFGDLLIHAGDFTMLSKRAAAILDFSQWLGELPHRFKLVVPGNHEFFLASDLARRSLISNATLLINEHIEIMGLKIWGSPTTLAVGGAFSIGSEKDRRALYSQIPSDTNVVITHGPPYGILDQFPGSNFHQGCRELREAVLQVKPLLHVFGHLHGAHGMVSNEDTLFVNAALLGPDGDLSESPIVLRMPRIRS